jgi:hypothetical protein
MGAGGKCDQPACSLGIAFADNTPLGIAARLAVPESCLCAPISTAVAMNGQSVAVPHEVARRLLGIGQETR